VGTKVSSVLKHKGHDVVTVAPQRTVEWVVKVLTQNRIGAVPVINEQCQLIGIISERDIIAGMSEHSDAVLTLAADQTLISMCFRWRHNQAGCFLSYYQSCFRPSGTLACLLLDCGGSNTEVPLFLGIPWANTTINSVKSDLDILRLSATLLLISDDKVLADLAPRIVKPPWKLVRQDADRYVSDRMLAEPNVRLVVLDDQGVDENDRGWLLVQIRKRFSGAPLLYVAGIQSDSNERLARRNGAQYYISKPLSPERFGHALESFLRTQQVKG